MALLFSGKVKKGGESLTSDFSIKEIRSFSDFNIILPLNLSANSSAPLSLKADEICVSAKDGVQIYELKERIGALAKAASAEADEKRIVADLIQRMKYFVCAGVVGVITDNQIPYQTIFFDFFSP